MKTTSTLFCRSFISSAAVLFTVPLTAHAAQTLPPVSPDEAVWQVIKGECYVIPEEDTVRCTYTVGVNDDPALSHMSLELPDGAVAVAPDTSTGSDGSLKGTDAYGTDDDPTDYVKWDGGQEVDTKETYTVDFQKDPDSADDNIWTAFDVGTCRMVLKGAQLYTVVDVPGPCRSGDASAEPSLQVKFSDPVPPLDQVNSQDSTDKQKCQDLIAGQHILVGSVCVEVEDLDGDGDLDTLSVTYDTDNEWNLVETHLWVENNEDPMMPANRKGNPKIGNFPYVSEYINDTVSKVEIPLESFGNLDEMLCEASSMSISLNAELAAHASVYNNDGGQETAWADGKEITTRGGSWAMKSQIKFTCE